MLNIFMKVAVLGASGLVGRSIIQLLNTQMIDYVGTYHTSPFPNGIHLSSTDVTSLELFFQKYAITACINCIAERNVDRCEKEEERIYEINSSLASRIAQACMNQNIFFVHISTDYVFDGSSPPYLPDSVPHPIQAYGRSKAEAEKLILEKNKEACIIRVPVLYTDLYKTLNETAVTILGKKILDKTNDWLEDNYFLRRPVFIQDMCEFILYCIKQQKKGIFHFNNPNDVVTKYQMCKMIGEYLDIPTSHIHPQNTPSTVAGRPFDTNLLDKQYDRTLFPQTSVAEGIAKCFHRFKHPRVDLTTTPTEDIFWLLDLDGTLVDTEKLHFICYTKAFQEHGYVFCDWDTYQSLPSIEEYCKLMLGASFDRVKETKNKIFYDTPSISFLKGADSFLQWLVDTKQNVVIVTNTSRATVDFYKEKLPLLHKVSQWITRDDVTNAKPNAEPYLLAKANYWKQEKYIVGIENTVCGYKALKQLTSCIYIITEFKSRTYNAILNEDVYFVKELSDIYTRVDK